MPTYALQNQVSTEHVFMYVYMYPEIIYTHICKYV